MEELDRRVVYAAERTMLAWIRTGLALMGFGFVVARFTLILQEFMALEPTRSMAAPGLSIWVGTLMVVLGVFCNAYGGFLYVREVRQIRNGEMMHVSNWPMGRLLGTAVSILGILMAAYLVYLAVQ